MDASGRSGSHLLSHCGQESEFMSLSRIITGMLIGAVVLAAERQASAQTTPPTAAPASSRPSPNVQTSAPIPDVIDSLARMWRGGNAAPVCRLDGQDMNGAPTTACVTTIAPLSSHPKIIVMALDNPKNFPLVACCRQVRAAGSCTTTRSPGSAAESRSPWRGCAP